MLLHYWAAVYATFVKIQQNIDYHQAILIARHYLSTDTHNAGSPFAEVCSANTIDCKQINHPEIKDKSDVLLLHNVAQNITFLAQDISNQSNEIMVWPNVKTHTGDNLHIFDGIENLAFLVSTQQDNHIQGDVTNHFAAKKIYPKQTLVFRSNTIAYYLRKSIVGQHNHNYAYTLYRDDLQRTAQALIEGIIDWQVQISPLDTWPLQVHIFITFKNSKQLDLKFIPLNQYKA